MIVGKDHVTKIYYPIQYEYMEMDCKGNIKDAGTETYYLKVGVIRGGHPKFPAEIALDILKHTAFIGLFLDANNTISVTDKRIYCRKGNGDTLTIAHVVAPADNDYVLDIPQGHHNVVYGVGNTDMLI